MAVEAGLSAGWQLMDDPLAEDRAGVWSLAFSGDCRSTEACSERKTRTSGPPWSKAGDELMRHTRGGSGRNRLLVEPHMYAADLACNF